MRKGTILYIIKKQNRIFLFPDAKKCAEAARASAATTAQGIKKAPSA